MSIETEDPRSAAFRAALARNASEQAFETWFRPLKLGKPRAEGTVCIVVPNAVAKDWILSNYRPVLESSLRELNFALDRIEWTFPESDAPSFESAPRVLPIEEFSSRYKSCEPSVSASIPSTPTASLNEVYTFGSFVEASCNRFAHAAARAVADNPGRTYNPLYIYGGVGLGKTHLIQAIGHAVKASCPNLQVAYLSLERFMNELIIAIRYGYDKTQIFRDKYRSIDVLLIDDVQFIAGKERTQEEFFHTFNALYDAQKQIVLTSDCPPREIPEIEERLHSRFEWGLIADLEPPDLETKIAILKRKAELQSINLPDDVALFLAEHCKHNVRELEGYLIRVLAMASLKGLPLSKSLALEALRHVSRSETESALSIPRIQRVVADYYKLTVDNLRARTNVHTVLLPRQVAMYLCKRLTKASYPEIAKQFGGKHHTTVIHSVEKIQQLITRDSDVSAAVKRLIDGLSEQ